MSNASSSSDRDELYKNWIKRGLGLKYVKNGVTKYVVDTVNKQHADFLKTGPCVKCTSCKLETLQPAHTCTFTKGSPKLCPLGMKKCLCLKKNQIPCPNNFCGAIHDEIVKSNRYRDPNWSNTDICKWSSEPWEVAKCFINISGYADKTTAEETDCSGILSIICNNFEFPAHLEQIAKEVKSTRNEIMHAPNLEVANTVLKQYLTNMEDLLASIPPGFPEVTSAITDIQMLNKTAFITPKDEKEMRLDAIKEFQIEKDRIIQELQTKEREISALTDQSKSEINDELNVAKTNIETETNASIKELHKDLNSNKDLAIQEMNKSKQGYIDEIKSTANKALSEISESKTEALQSITHQTRQTKDSLTELHVKHKDVEMKLDDLEQTLFTEQKNVKILSGRTDVIEEKQKLMEANISKLNSKHTDSPNELSTLKKELGNLDQKMDALVSLEDKEELRADLFKYYQKQFSNMCVSPGVSCPLRLVGNILYQTTEIEPDIDEESENLQIEDTEDEMNNLVTDNKDLLENSYKSVFYKENKQLNSVLLVGKSRKGKTAWCWNLLQKWVNSCLKKHENEHVRDGSAKAERDRETAGEVGGESLKDDEMFLCKFDVVIYLPLRYVRDLPNCITIAELMQNCLSVPLYQNKRKDRKTATSVKIK
ncbi:uncharacterized protein LOC123546108 [Mercenaria mercenaria]|uniref:uncharacterized protein LOC123546108 n=1 Tax=Mercenaria mercenaria TaxID=6596 RepID=UPI00234F599D|nr:uncharacterized protein LOC123546108 [Mercenaria mercenaria]